jgi:2-hydroxychromene-2-carboxylate isomerase
LPLIWPDLGPETVRPAMRVASLAAERGCAAAFVLAATRLAFCGGYELDHPEALAEAAAAANLGLEDCLKAAGDESRDGPLEEGARRLMAQGADRLPVLRVGRLLFSGEDRLGEALAAANAPERRAG